MTSREIVQRLIDDHIINGEEAFTLINDICKNEMYDVWKTLEGNNKQNVWNGFVYPSISTTTSPTWTSASTVTTHPDSYRISASTKGVKGSCGGV